VSAATPPLDAIAPWMADDPTATPPPHVDLHVERAILGSCLLSWAPVARACTLHVAAEDFFRAGHREILAAIRQVDAQGGIPELVSVVSMLRAAGRLEAAGGMAYVAALIDGVPRQTAQSLVWFTTRLQQLARNRRAAHAVTQLRAMALDPEAMVDGSLADQLGIVAGLVEGAPTSGRVLGPAEQWAALVQEASRDASKAVPLPLPSINAALNGGIRPGEVLGLLARPGIGKTVTLAETVTTLAASGRVGMFFSLEMPAAQIVARCVGMHYRLRPGHVWGRARASDGASGGWASAMAGLRLCDAPALSVGDMDRIVSREPRKPDLVIVDHLGLVGGDPRLSTYDRTSKQARELKELAKRRDVAVLVAIQVSREAGGAYGEKRLGLGSARDSGVIEEVLDYQVGIRRFDRLPTLPAAERERLKEMLFVSIAKNRHGAVPDTEWAYFIAPEGLRLIEQADCQPPDILDTGATFGGRRR